MQTILGSTGIIGRTLAKELVKYTNKLRLVSRNPQKVNIGDELVKADLLKEQEVYNAVSGSDIVYLTAGLKYDTKTWQDEWHVIMRNVIDACKASCSRLVFFDNVYAYGRVNGWMTEKTQYKPVSKKGDVRKQIAEMLMDEVKQGSLNAMIVRAADFYGEGTASVISETVFKNFAAGKIAQWLISDKYSHSFTYAPDAAKGTALLGNTPAAFNQVWHLPTDKNAMTGEKIIPLIAAEFGVNSKYMNIPKWILRIIGLFNSNIRESIEMLYQNDSNYLFSSEKFEKAFNLKPTLYITGIKETVHNMKKKNKY